MAAGNATIFVRVIDNQGGVATFLLGSTYLVRITLDESIITDMMSSMVSNDCNSYVVNALQAGNLQQTSQIATALSASLNSMSDASSSNSTNSSADAAAANKRVAVRDMLVTNLVNLPVSDISSAKLVASSLSSVTGAVGENSLSSAV